MFKENDPITMFVEEVGIINGFFVGKNNFFMSKNTLYDVKDMTGQLCMVELRDIEAGHHPKGKRKWGK